jgi:hypothetical protein
MTTTPNSNDPYAHCEERCTHDLGKGVLLEELLADDGPHPSVFEDLRPGGFTLGRDLRARLVRPEAAA